jgi:hypothetical protein
VGGLGHILEQEGLATTQVSLIREHTEKIRPPRALWVPFELGRPLGAPGDPDFQRDVLRAVLALLDEPEGPVLRDFPRDAPARTDGDAAADEEAWVCPISLAPPPDADDPEAALLAEVAEMRPWHDIAVERLGRTTTGTSGLEIEEAARFIAGHLAEPWPESPDPGMHPAEVLKLATEDLKAYYGEAIAAQPGSPTSRESADWFWGETVAGATLLALHPILKESADKRYRLLANAVLVPRSQQHRL